MVSIEKIHLLLVFIVRAGTLFGGFISGCNMNPTNTRICFIVSHHFCKMCEMWRSPYKLDNFRGIRKTFESFEQVRQNLVAVWSTPEKSAKISYIIGNLD